jgi:FkbM family methyltransferase
MRKFIRRLVKLLIRSYPLFRGGVRLAHMSLPLSLTQDDEWMLTRLRHGPYLLVRVNDYCGRALYYWGDYDRKITWTCRRLLRPGDCCLDIGANYGEVGMYAGKFVGPLGQVHVFEPQPKLADHIRVSAELNGFRHVHTHAVALSDEDGDVDLYIPHESSSRASLVDTGEVCDVVRVPVRRSGAYLGQLDLPPIAVMKLDVEGHEERVLSGAHDLLKKNKPQAIVFESHDDGGPFFQRGTVRLISELGYDFFQIRQRSLFRVQLKELHDSDSVENGYDFVALSTDPDQRDVRRGLHIA